MKETTQTMTRYDGESTIVEKTIGVGQESSVEISQNAKGEPKVTVKIYNADPFEAMAQAIAVYNEANTRLKLG